MATTLSKQLIGNQGQDGRTPAKKPDGNSRSWFRRLMESGKGSERVAKAVKDVVDGNPGSEATLSGLYESLEHSGREKVATALAKEFLVLVSGERALAGEGVAAATRLGKMLEFVIRQGGLKSGCGPGSKLYNAARAAVNGEKTESGVKVACARLRMALETDEKAKEDFIGSCVSNKRNGLQSWALQAAIANNYEKVLRTCYHEGILTDVLAASEAGASIIREEEERMAREWVHGAIGFGTDNPEWFTARVLKTQAGIRMITEALDSADAEQRVRALRSIASLGEGAAFPILSAWMKEEKTRPYAFEAATMLKRASSGLQDAIASWTTESGTTVPEREAAREALGEILGKEALMKLAALQGAMEAFLQGMANSMATDPARDEWAGQGKAGVEEAQISVVLDVELKYSVAGGERPGDGQIIGMKIAALKGALESIFNNGIGPALESEPHLAALGLRFEGAVENVKLELGANVQFLKGKERGGGKARPGTAAPPCVQNVYKHSALV